jgi:hypothetical protein
MQVWRPSDSEKPVASDPGSEVYRPDILDAIERTIGDFDDDLRKLSLDIHCKYFV